MREFTEQELVRREKAEKIKSMGLDPFGERFDRTGYAKEINEKYKDIPHDDFENINDIYTVAGRIMFIRKMGKAIPVKLRQHLTPAAKADEVCQLFGLFHLSVDREYQMVLLC